MRAFAVILGVIASTALALPGTQEICLSGGNICDPAITNPASNAACCTSLMCLQNSDNTWTCQ